VDAALVELDHARNLGDVERALGGERVLGVGFDGDGDIHRDAVELEACAQALVIVVRQEHAIDAPSDRGNVLFRHLVLSKPQLSLVAAEQAQDDCRPVTAPPAKPGASGEPLKAAGRGRSAAP